MQLLTAGMITTLLFPILAHAAGPLEIDSSTKLIRLPQPIRITSDGLIQAAKDKWSSKLDVDGSTQILVAKTVDAKAAVMKSAEGKPESFTAYMLTPSGAVKAEDSGTVFYSKGRVAAVTSCTSSGAKDSIGRICVTATQRLCQGLRSGDGVDADAMKEMENYEMRSLASILTLRGSDHQLDNVVKSGNRLGLRTSLQTTKGQLIALAKQVAKESGHPVAEAPAAPAEETGISAKEMADRAAADNLLAKNVLEKSLPRLKESCLASRF